MAQEKNNWKNIENNRFRLLCNKDSCTRSIANLLDGRLHISTIHGEDRHTVTLTTNDMFFITSQFLSTLDQQSLIDYLTYCEKNLV